MVPGVDILAWLQAAIDQMVTTAGVLQGLVIQLGSVLGVFSLVIAAMRGAWAFMNHQTTLAFREMFDWLRRFLSVSGMIGFYQNPIPGIGIAFPDLFSFFGLSLANTFTMTNLGIITQNIANVMHGIEHPPLWNVFALIIYFGVLVLMSLLDLMLVGITGLAFLALGLGKAFGGLLIICYLIPKWEYRFWGWVDFMLIFAMYRAVATAYVYVACQFLLNLFNNMIQTDYSIGHFTALFAFMIASIGIILYGAFQVPRLTIELFGGGPGHSGTSLGWFGAGLLGRAFRRF